MRLNEYIQEFEGLDPEERLEMLIDFGSEFPALGPDDQDLNRRSECQVQECQTPVYLRVALQDGRVRMAAHVPEKSPTVRGLVAMLVNGLNGSTPAEIAAVSDNMPEELGLTDVLGMTRYRGFKGIVAFIKRETARLSRLGDA